MGGGRGGSGRGGGGPDEEELGEYWDLLENEIRPIKPIPTCPDSQRIFSEHKEVRPRPVICSLHDLDLRILWV